MSRFDLRKIIRKNLIENKFDEDILQPIIDNTEYPEGENDDLVTTKNI